MNYWIFGILSYLGPWRLNLSFYNKSEAQPVQWLAQEQREAEGRSAVLDRTWTESSETWILVLSRSGMYSALTDCKSKSLGESSDTLSLGPSRWDDLGPCEYGHLFLNPGQDYIFHCLANLQLALIIKKWIFLSLPPVNLLWNKLETTIS